MNHGMKAYNELVGKIKRAYLYAQTGSTKAVLEDILPELRESEDERIRKGLLKMFNHYVRNNIELIEYDLDKDMVLAWLEKQGKQKPVDKVEPEFREGDWIVQENIGTYKVIEVCEAWYEVIDVEDNHYSIAFDKEYMCHFWTIQDAKPGDVLASKDELSILIFRNLDTSTIFSSYYNIQRKGELGWSNECFIPATKEQRDLLFRKMKEEGYEWDAEKKEPKNIKQSPSWSEEDEEKFRDVIRLIKQGAPVQSMRDHYTNWLKSLKERYTWKPSDEQMKALCDLNITGNISYAGQGQTLIELYNDLKKLKGE